MLVLDSPDAEADAALFARWGIGSFAPFRFERAARRPDGSETKVAFTLAFAADESAPRAAFFVCQQHFPENFWNPSFQRHANGASGTSAVGLTAETPAEHEAFLVAFSGSTAQRTPEGALSIELLGSRLNVVPDTREHGTIRFRSITLRVPDLAAQAERLMEMGVPCAVERDGIAIPAEAALGVEIRFVANAHPLAMGEIAD